MNNHQSRHARRLTYLHNLRKIRQQQQSLQQLQSDANIASYNDVNNNPYQPSNSISFTSILFRTSMITAMSGLVLFIAFPAFTQ